MDASSNESDCIGEGNTFIDEGSRSCRNKKGKITYCPVCSITLRPSEVNTHFFAELDRLCTISTRHRANGKSSSPSTSNSSSKHDKEWDTYQKVRSNRHKRQRSKSRKRLFDEINCPICNLETTEVMNIHVERCLHHSGQGSDSDDDIDVEGEYDFYQWAGETHIRTTSLLPGGVGNLGTALGRTDEDEDLVVDGDDTNLYGLQQYTEEDIIVYDTNKEQQALRKAVLGCDDNSILNNTATASETEFNVDSDYDPTVEALKSRIRELENNSIEDSFKCLICMERYKTPVISTCCWHVHCEQCWLKTLSAKKLCPQCNMITSPSNLRRIYM